MQQKPVAGFRHVHEDVGISKGGDPKGCIQGFGTKDFRRPVMQVEGENAFTQWEYIVCKAGEQKSAACERASALQVP